MITRVTLTLAQDHSVWFFLGVTCLAVGLVVYFYRKAATSLPKRTLFMLVGLRVLAVGLVIVALFRPVLSFRHRASRSETLSILVDRSKSMAITDYPNVPSRLEQVREVLVGREGILDELDADFETSLWAFDASAEALPGAAGFETVVPEGAATQLAASLKEAVDAADRGRLHAVIVFTDGMDTSGADVLARARELGVTIHCVGVGARLVGQKSFKDIQIAKVETKRSAPVDNITEVAILVEAVNLKGRQVPVSIVKDESEVARTMITLDNVPGPQAVTVRFTPKEKGLIEYKAVIPVDSEERISENNEQEFTLNVTDPQIRVLHVAGTVGPDYKYLSRMMRKDPNIQPLAFIKVRTGVIKSQGEVSGVAGGGLPETAETLEKFDVIVLDDIDATHFTAPQMKAMTDRIEAGAGLLMLRGKGSFGAGGYGATPLAGALPVAVGGRDDGEKSGRFKVELTSAGRIHPAVSGLVGLFDDPTAGLTLDVVNSVGAPRPGSEVLALGPEGEGEGAARMPLLIVGRHGRGRTAAFTGGPTYRWLLLLKGVGRESPYNRFWGQMIRWLAAEDVKKTAGGPGVEAALDAALYDPGSVVSIDATARDVEGLLTNTASLTAEISGPAGATATLELARSMDSTGAYEATYTPPGPGEYAVNVVANEEGTRLGEKKLAFRVGEPNMEFERFDLDEQLLKNVAEATGGKYVPLVAADDLVAGLAAHAAEAEELVVISLWNSYALFIIFVILVTVEWVTRRRWQLG